MILFMLAAVLSVQPVMFAGQADATQGVPIS